VNIQPTKVSGKRKNGMEKIKVTQDSGGSVQQSDTLKKKNKKKNPPHISLYTHTQQTNKHTHTLQTWETHTIYAANGQQNNNMNVRDSDDVV
jgi:hypothetical protein